MTPRLFCFGLGFTGAAFARACRSRGFEVAGTTRSPTKRDRLMLEVG